MTFYFLFQSVLPAILGRTSRPHAPQRRTLFVPRALFAPVWSTSPRPVYWGRIQFATLASFAFLRIRQLEHFAITIDTIGGLLRIVVWMTLKIRLKFEYLLIWFGF